MRVAPRIVRIYTLSLSLRTRPTRRLSATDAVVWPLANAAKNCPILSQCSVDPIEVTRNLLAYKFARFWALPWMEEPATRWPPTKNPEEPDNEGVAQSIADSWYTPLSVPVPF